MGKVARGNDSGAIRPSAVHEGVGAYVALQLTQGVGGATLRHLVNRFGSPEAVFQASPEVLRGVPGLRPSACQALVAGPDQAVVSQALEAMERVGAWLLTYWDPAYPPLLKAIPDPPPLLYGLGDPASLARPAVAVVGSRLATQYGLHMARDLATGLVGGGLTVISGLARGIDAAAHEAALAAGGQTVAVLGCGIDVPYPRENIKLNQRIAAQGAVVTEFPPGAGPEPYHFPIRNRIISGLSLGVVIVEASRRSGSLITAASALEQGREVFAVPGSVCSYKSGGTHWLIKQGARLVEGVGDILEELGLDGTRGAGWSPVVRSPAALVGNERRLYDVLESYPQHLDDLACRSSLPVSQVCGLLLQMELKDLVQALPGQMYQRK